jgi:Putative auto-transporter adhesin, head GIN domain
MRIRSWLVAIALVSPLLLGACDSDTSDDSAVTASGNVVMQDLGLTGFTTVEAENAFSLDISQAETFSVTVRVDENIQDQVDVSVTGDTLKLRLKGPLRIRGDVTLEASIKMPSLEGLQLSGASSGDLSGIISTAQIDIVLSGASSVEGDLTARSLEINASGASNVALEGSAVSMSIDVSGASSLDLASLPVETVEVTLSGASDATVNARNRIDPAEASGASHLRYLGDPSLGDVKTSGASTVEAVED